MTDRASRETIDAMRAILVAALLLAPVTAVAMPMRGPNGETIEAEPEKVQFWTNQGFRPISDAEIGREIQERAAAASEPRPWYSDTTNVLGVALLATLAAFAVWHFAVRKT